MAEKVRWFAAVFVVTGALFFYSSSRDSFGFLVGVILIAASALAFLLSFLVRWDLPVSSDITVSPPRVLCPRGVKCDSGWEGTVTACVQKEVTAAVPTWARGVVDQNTMLNLESQLGQLGTEFQTFECPVCGTLSLFLIHHGEPVDGCKLIAVKLGRGIFD